MRLHCIAEDNSGISYVRVSYSVDSENYYEIVTKEADGEKEYELNYLWDVSAINEGNIIVRYEVVDICNNSNISIAPIQTYRIDRTAPCQVEGINVKDTDGAISLTWNKQEEEDEISYSVYRKSDD